MDLLPQVQKTIARWQLLAAGDSLLIAVSGGPDSVALLHLLWRLRHQFKLQLVVAHLNHGLRGDLADEDQTYVRQLAGQLGLPFFTETRDVAAIARESKLSVEEAGRFARYGFFARIGQQLGISKVAVGHNADDQAETILMRLLRGAGRRGLSGIAPLARHDGLKIVRPLFECTREQIEAYCLWAGLSPRLDATNNELLYFRSRVRHRYLPLLEAENPALRRQLVQNAQILRSEDEYLEQIAGEISRDWPEGEIPLSAFGEHIALVRRATRMAVCRWFGQVWSFAHIEQILSLAGQEAGRTVSLPGGRQAVRGQETIKIGYPRWRPVCRRYVLHWPGSVWIPEWDLKLTLWQTAEYHPGPGREYFLARELTPPLLLRTRQTGDRFQPRGVGGTKKLKDWFIDAKLPRDERERIPLLTDGEGILWVVGKRRASRALPRDGEQLLAVRLENEEQTDADFSQR